MKYEGSSMKKKKIHRIGNQWMICGLLVLLTACVGKEPENKIIQESKELMEKRSATLAFTGDILLEEGILTWMSDFYTNDEYRFKHYFDEIKPLLQADLLIGNQEVPIAGRSYGITGINFRFNAPEEVAPQLTDLGFDVLTFANNHSYDQGKAGLDATIQALNQEKIATTGAFRQKEDRGPLIIEKNGIRFAILAYTYDTNQPIEDQNDFSVNRFLNATHEFDDEHKEALKQDVMEAKDQSDVVIAAMHWGTEFTYDISQTQKEVAKFLNECGVHIVIGNHPHTLQTVETMVNTKGEETFVIYSLGNFVSSAAAVSRASEQFTNMYELGGIVHCDVTYDPNTKKVELSHQKMDVIVNHFTYGYDNFQLLPFETYTDELASQHYQRWMSLNFHKEYLNENLKALFDNKIEWK